MLVCSAIGVSTFGRNGIAEAARVQYVDCHLPFPRLHSPVHHLDQDQSDCVATLAVYFARPE